MVSRERELLILLECRLWADPGKTALVCKVRPERDYCDPAPIGTYTSGWTVNVGPSGPVTILMGCPKKSVKMVKI